MFQLPHGFTAKENMAEAPAPESCDPSVSMHNFSEKLLDKKVHFQILKLKDSFFLWIGLDRSMKNLSVALPLQLTRAESSSVAVSQLLGDTDDSSSNSLAARLSKRTNQQVFVSCNLPAAESMLIPLVEQFAVRKVIELLQGDE